uniref:TRF2/HOY1 PH-like domain-containing protein n=1 Tax=Leersia perrieri TaxID=77586 RepID=A0A0D9WQ13_9ORYZ
MEITELGGGCNVMQLMETTEILEDTCNSKNMLRGEDLELKPNEPFLNYMRLALDSPTGEGNFSNISSKELESAQDQLEWQSRIKPTRLPVLKLHTGNKMFTRTAECDIFVKFLYHKKSVVVCQMRKDRMCRMVDVPFDNITSFCFSFDQQSDILKIEVNSSLKFFSAAKPPPGMFHQWEVDDSKDDEFYFPESKYLRIETGKGSMEKCYAKLLYANPDLPCLVTSAN